MANRFRFEGNEYELSRLMLSEARAIQKVTGLTIGEFETALGKGDVEALTAMIWVCQKRENPTLRFDDVDGDLSTFEPIEVEVDEPEPEGKDEPEAEPTAGPPSAEA